jgi:hypothetical protein
MDGMLAFSQSSGEADLSSFPERERSIILEFLSFWKLDPPKPLRSKRGGEFALWIMEADQLQSACAEYPIKAVFQEVYKDWLKSRYSVSHPGAVVKAVKGKVAEFRSTGKPPEIPQVGLEGYDPEAVKEFQERLKIARSSTNL